MKSKSLFLLFLVTANRKLKYVFLVNTFLVGLSVILQKAHYSIDVFVAPFIAYGVFKFILYINENYFQKDLMTK